MQQSQAGFTLIEVIVVIIIVGVIFAGISAISFGVLGNSRLTVETDRVVETLRRAQSRSVNGLYDDVWSVHVTSADITLYKGDDYATRDTSFDDQLELNSSVSSSLNDVTFKFKTGATDDTGTITLTSPTSGTSATIEINDAGLVSKQ
jgi:prepilin-type N-terminal cleavage/methylation domain-containing protein